MNNIDFTPQGWECPKCKRVYSPTTMMCIACPSLTPTTTSNTVNDVELTCVFEPGGKTDGLYFPDFCKKCGKQKHQHRYTVYNAPKNNDV